MNGAKVYIGGCRSGKTVAVVAEKLMNEVDKSIYDESVAEKPRPWAIEAQSNPLRFYNKPHG